MLLLVGSLSSRFPFAAHLTCYSAHEQAYTKCHLLHRDISAGNILINETNGNGMLIDWEFAKPMDDLEIPRSVEYIVSSSILNSPFHLYIWTTGHLGIYVCSTIGERDQITSIAR